MIRLRAAVIVAACATCLAARPATAAQSWRISGDLSEACTCSVPCSCNFGETPSPHSFCWALFSMNIKTGHYGTVPLNGLRLAGASGARGIVMYVDQRANGRQAQALHQIALTILHKMYAYYHMDKPGDIPLAMRLRAFRTASIDQSAGSGSNHLKIGSLGRFDAKYILGMDRKTPMMVANNWSWNIQHNIKAKTTELDYADSFGNRMDFKGTNSNQGTFDWTQSTPIYMR